jgi:hypothetical protein
LKRRLSTQAGEISPEGEIARPRLLIGNRHLSMAGVPATSFARPASC